MDACCVSCGSHNLVEDVHEGHVLVVCSDCGHVAAETAQANLTLNYGDVLTDVGPSGVFVHAHDVGDLAGNAGAAGYFRGAAVQYRLRDRARATADQLSLSHQHRDLLLDLVDLVHSLGHQSRLGWEPLLAACAYIVVRQQELPLTLRDVAVATNIHVHKIAHCMRHVLRSCAIQLPPNNLRALITRHLSTILARAPASATARPAPAARAPPAAAAHPITRAALQLLELLQATSALSSWSPLSVAAAVVRLAVEAHVPPTQQQRWLVAHIHAALNMPCPHAAPVVQALKAFLLSLAPLLPHLPPNDPLALVRNLPDVLRLSTLLASLPSSTPPPPADTPPSADPPLAALPAAHHPMPALEALQPPGLSTLPAAPHSSVGRQRRRSSGEQQQEQQQEELAVQQEEVQQHEREEQHHHHQPSGNGELSDAACCAAAPCSVPTAEGRAYAPRSKRARTLPAPQSNSTSGRGDAGTEAAATGGMGGAGGHEEAVVRSPRAGSVLHELPGSAANLVPPPMPGGGQLPAEGQRKPATPAKGKAGHGAAGGARAAGAAEGRALSLKGSTGTKEGRVISGAAV